MKYKSASIFIFFILIFLSSCSNDKPADKKSTAIDSSITNKKNRDAKNYFRDCKLLLAEAIRMDTILYRQLDVSKGLGNQAITAFTDFAYYCSNDSLSPVFLIKTAQVATAINNIPQAKLALEKCIADYPKFSNISAAMFLLARLYDEQTYLNNEEEAKRLYNEIITKYPESPEAESSKGALKYIDKTDKQLMEELKKVTITTN
jgi:hypothetical protein